MKDALKYLLFIGIVFTLLVLAGFAEVYQSDKDWNNGICEKCGGSYQFASAVHYRNSGDYFYYTCGDCGHTIKTCKIMK